MIRYTAQYPLCGARHNGYFHKCCRDAEAVFLAFGFVSARSQAAAGMLPRQNFAKRLKILAPPRYIISVNALIWNWVARAASPPEGVRRWLGNQTLAGKLTFPPIPPGW
jgi:hypothetical protein